MYKKAVVDFVTRHTEITSIVSEDDLVTHVLPLRRGIEPLVCPAVVTESRVADLSHHLQVLKALFECFEAPKL